MNEKIGINVRARRHTLQGETLGVSEDTLTGFDGRLWVSTHVNAESGDSTVSMHYHGEGPYAFDGEADETHHLDLTVCEDR